ncbi:MAG: aldo/keto reductase family oxidoreductase [Actinomycetes bacterium]
MPDLPLPDVPTVLPSVPAGRRLGTSSIEVGALAFGCWRFAGTSVAEARDKVETAVGLGMTLVDTADIYGFDGQTGFGAAESLLGEVLATTPGLRDRIVLATKGGIRPPVPYDQSPEYLVAACRASLERLQVGQVDLYQVHRPDLLAHPAELATALRALVSDGLVREVGVSNFTRAQTEALAAHLGFPVATTQPELSALCLDALTDGTLDDALRVGRTPLAWSPLGGGRLGSGAPADDARTAAVHEVLDRVAHDHGSTRAAVALAWVLAHPSRPVPIVGTQQVSRLAELASATSVRLDRSEWYDVLVAARGEAMP